ncbi:hypothetical protein [Urbifossiella limnaea]|uniref:Uncharacterized protein n=1 Tax=Urbifossiella limnaea TaxID=2528023 RepID=A0A517XY22_9BACT|nr:hypothetical protein [Urbifossiella limnaea]QDU22410.1 hypothetical protein ETAA1_43900 [Urbifossiella limnaea]
MADTPPTARDPGPPLGSTADPVGYVPVSWMAVAAFVVTVIFVGVLAVLAVTSWKSKSPLIAPQMLFLPVVAVVLAFAARRIVRNSEGTRTGELFGFDLINAAWWGAVVVGLVYFTYLFAIEVAVRAEAESEVGKWVGQVLDEKLTPAFYRTRDPAERASMGPDNATALEARYKVDWVAFSQCDLVRTALRNPKACTYVPGGLRDWSIQAGGVACVATGTLVCPEGKFPMQFPLKAVDAVAGSEGSLGRQWQVVPSQNGFQRDDPQLTSYGWLVRDLQLQGRSVVQQFMADGRDRVFRPYAAYVHAGLAGDPDLRLLSPDGGATRLAGVGVPAGLGWQMPDHVFSVTAAKLFRLPGNKSPGADQSRQFFNVWNAGGIVPAGERLRNTPDVHELMTFTDSAVEVRVPVELPVESKKADLAARGRVVVECTDPALLADLKQLRASANPESGTISPPAGSGPRQGLRWRVVRVESDMRPVQTRESEGPPGGGGPGGMGM